MPLTLLLSGRQEAEAGEAESGRWPVHSKGLFDCLLAANPEEQAISINSLMKTDVFPSLSPRSPLRKAPVSERVPGITAMSHSDSASVLFIQSRGLLNVPHGARIIEINNFCE